MQVHHLERRCLLHAHSLYVCQGPYRLTNEANWAVCHCPSSGAVFATTHVLEKPGLWITGHADVIVTAFQLKSVHIF